MFHESFLAVTPCCPAAFATYLLSSQFCEILTPAILVLLIGAFKELIEVEEHEAFVPAADVPVVPYEVIQDTASYPNILCHDNNAFYRFGEQKL